MILFDYHSKMPLILQGGGGYPETKIMDKLFFDALPTDKKILYIPIAMVGGYTFDQCYDYITGIAKDLGKSQKIEMKTDLDSLPENLSSEYGGIYIGGGNTFKLLHDIQKTGAERKIRNFIDEGGLVCGGSAGAIIFGKDIDSAADANITGIRDVSGFNMLKGATLWCHYNKDQKNEIIEYVSHHSSTVIALPENAGLILDATGMKSIGEDKITIFTKNNCIDLGPGERLEI